MFRDNQSKKTKREESPFDIIYNLVKTRNTKELFQYKYQYICALTKSHIEIPLRTDNIQKKSVLTNYGNGLRKGFTIGMLLAIEGDHESVDFLLKHSLARHDEVILGYAIKGDVKRVNEHQRYIVPPFNNDHRADFSLVYPYAFGGHFEQAIKQRPWIFEQYRDTCLFFNLVIKGFADGGQFSSFARLFAYDKDPSNIINAATAICNTEYFSLDNLPYLIAHIDHSGLRKEILSRIPIGYMESRIGMPVPVEPEKLEKMFLNLNHMMSEHHLNFDLASSMLDPGVKTWLLQAPQLVKEDKIIGEIFWIVTSLCLGLSEADTKKVYLSMHDRLFRLNLTTEPVKNAKLAFSVRSSFTSIFNPAVISKVEESNVVEEPSRANSACSIVRR